eukprot:TRINITY_DN15643_c0_g1_i1.p4 TRINITY_DN15643_c0_g1~~TRINITY_DN15643_c0_g1_i1.p4  ORF type:complete len:104 (-),score=12.57 TRINITY_DN15643_c0_g1_i1:788-1099(-)
MLERAYSVCVFSFFFSSRRRHTRSCLVSWARRCVQETVSTQSTWVKPHREFWDRILETEKADPSTTFFIDDNQPNIEGSIDAGLRGILFTSADALGRELGEYL